jgi:hypothetical protein
MSSIDPLEERRLRLEQAEREARGDFSRPVPPPKPVPKAGSAAAASKNNDSWAKYKGGSARDDDDDTNPNAILNKQHNNLRAQAKIDLAMAALLDTSMPRQER